MLNKYLHLCVDLRVEVSIHRYVWWNDELCFVLAIYEYHFEFVWQNLTIVYLYSYRSILYNIVFCVSSARAKIHLKVKPEKILY